MPWNGRQDVETLGFNDVNDADNDVADRSSTSGGNVLPLLTFHSLGSHLLFFNMCIKFHNFVHFDTVGEF